MRAGKLKFAVVAAVAWGMAVTALQGQETATPRTGTLIKAGKSSQFGRRTGSPYVELDSWIYPALERLAALGYIHSEFSDMRPWARVECGRMVQEAGMVLDVNPGGSSEAQRFYRLLRNEFELELGEMSGARGEGAVHLESLYSRVVGISGKPLNDSYHFGQTLINNYGRPYQEGFNSYNGFSGYAVAGRFVIYTRGEFQHAPAAPLTRFRLAKQSPRPTLICYSRRRHLPARTSFVCLMPMQPSTSRAGISLSASRACGGRRTTEAHFFLATTPNQTTWYA